MNLWRKAFSLGDIRYGWLLIVSMAMCVAFFYCDRYYDPDDQSWLSAGYAMAFATAVLWGALNYIGHIRLNAMYRKQNDIRAYVGQLAMSEDDKAELRNYLEDYAADLTEQGKSKEEATAEAISQFKVKELLSLSKNTALFQLHAHYYMIGWIAVALVLAVLTEMTRWLMDSNALWFMIVEAVFAAYGAGLFGLFVVYKLLDAFIHRKLNDHLS
ncbi:permease prefix domain 1-containing protein [Paenibacillus arenilitoris]|uniref:Uncharacterized protein n=1 Tax=Paenibacillus arenilitoris TaxID=2772299 RepID=A0A927CPC3_9BACL|nr:permease prefix domain 1-containing protein [Paenibacillus arenilitoris]MBD2869260.1 hypothetical protein [Paenibacillus arenilitoris]